MKYDTTWYNLQTIQPHTIQKCSFYRNSQPITLAAELLLIRKQFCCTFLKRTAFWKF